MAEMTDDEMNQKCAEKLEPPAGLSPVPKYGEASPLKAWKQAGTFGGGVIAPVDWWAPRDFLHDPAANEMLMEAILAIQIEGTDVGRYQMRFDKEATELREWFLDKEADERRGEWRTRGIRVEYGDRKRAIVLAFLAS